MARQLPVLAMDRHEIARTHERQHELQLLFAAVPGNMHVLEPLVDHLGAASGDVVDHSSDGFFIPRDGTCREHHGVARSHFHVAVIVDADAGQRGVRFALRSCGDAHDLARHTIGHLAVADQDAWRDRQISKTLRDRGIVDHAAADKRHLTAEPRGQIHENLHPVDARRERGDDQLAAHIREDFLEGVDHVQIRPREPASIDIGAVAEQREYPRAPELGEAMKIEVLAVDGRLIDLEVARVDEGPDRTVNGHRNAVGHAVGHPNELHLQLADAYPIAGLDSDEPALGFEAMLPELLCHELQGQRRAVDRPVDVRQHVRHGADVVFVSVRQHERLWPTTLGLQIGKVRDDEIDAQ